MYIFAGGICHVIKNYREREGATKSPLFVAMIDRKKIEALIDQRIADLDNGLFVVELSISPSDVITVELDKWDGGVSVEDCLAVSRNIEHNLDREEHDFELTVSSAGLDRPLRVKAQYEKNIGREVDVTLKNGTKHQGILNGIDDQNIDIEQTHTEKVAGTKKKTVVTQRLSIPINTIKATKLVISIK